MGFLPSIGEVVAADGDTTPSIESDWGEPNFDSKPGAKVEFPNKDTWKPDYSSSNNKWASYGDRAENNPFILSWDDWDQVLLRNSRARIKRLFKNYYNFRDFDPSDPNFGKENFVASFTANLKASLSPASGERILPWFKKRKLRSNPFNKNGELCKKSS